MNKIIKNLNAIKENIKIAADEADRDIDDIKLIIVTKKFTEERIKPLLDEGHLFFGENNFKPLNFLKKDKVSGSSNTSLSWAKIIAFKESD